MQTEIKTDCPSKRRALLFRALFTPIAMLAAGTAVGILTGKLPLMLTATAFTGVLVILLTVLRPDIALILFFCGTVMMTDASSLLADKSGFAIPDIDIMHGLPSILTLFFLALFCTTMVRVLFFEKRRLLVSPMGLGVYIAILLLTLLTSLFRASDPGMIRVDLMKMLFPVLCFYMCIAILNSRERIERLLMVLVAVSALKALILAVFYLAGRGWPYEPTYRIVTLDSADLLAFITFVLIALHLLARRNVRGFRAGLIGAACLPMIFAIIFSYRRAQWLGAVFSLGLLYLGAAKAIRRRIAMVLAVALCAGCALAVVSGIQKANLTRIGSRIVSIFDQSQHSNVHHKLEAQQVMQEISHSPLLGLGFGSEHSGVAKYEGIPTNVVHNTFLYIWMKLGLPGLVFFIWMAVLYGRRILRFRKNHLEDESWGLLLPLAASSGLWLAMFLTSPIPWYLHQTFFKALVAAVVMSLILQAERTGQIRKVLS